ncbi:MAG: GAF domain-containing protein [Candidatus Omnitrophica bacterium]|nr:GAF domain-containing protein [Candidatus Omnitrophota bacterium]MBU1997229.1 GAF domain-containing protein [Candidatus Omnitrophota bacterium]MBU4333466.1 GAF domain-containing protein [Candidatus Omnitrophota bacterium]
MNRREDSIFSHKSWDILCKVRDTLKVNVFIVDISGKMIVPPEIRRYGGSLLMDPAMGFDLRINADTSLSTRTQFGGKYFELRNRFNLHCLGIPVFLDELVVGNIIVGPMVINKRLSPEKYSLLAKEQNLYAAALISNINDLRIVSNMDASSMLGLINEIAVNNVEMIAGNDDATKRADRIEQEVTANFKGFLKGILKFANVESGSIMALDPEGKNLTVKAVEGMDKGIIGQSIKLGSGIAGIAASEKESFLIGSTSDDNRIAHLLKRRDIKRSLVLPLVNDDRVCGVLNLHTKKSNDHITANLDSINYFSELFARSA